jgi:phosphoglycolate phosphatase
MRPLLVFDLDGTLVDSRRDLADSANRMLAVFGASPLSQEAIVGMVGDGAQVLVERALTSAGLDPERPGALEAFLRIYDERLANHTRPYDGVREALVTLREHAGLAVLTNKPARHTTRLLDMLDLAPFFDAGVLGGDTSYGRKPDPAGLLSLVSAAGSRTDLTVMIGDSRVDLATAERARVRFCLAQYGFGHAPLDEQLPPGTLVVADPLDLGERLVEFLGTPT